ncbi:MAG: hypothetical protein HOO06_15560 [Bdellovibrionaceae bacterium]|jgi:uncharacterized protein|nr:hypothetical protein [Pseudobdellovibrionaceae bacterium]
MKVSNKIVFSLFIFTLVGCATYQLKVSEGRRHIENRQFAKAAEVLKSLALQESDDQLVYLLDYATALQIAGEYKESNKAFMAADVIAEESDYHSISRIGGSLLLSEGMVQYKGDPFEKVTINAMMAINFLMMENYDSALVEAKRINTKLGKYETDGRKRYDQSAFAYYLSAMIWEAQKKYDDAYIDYKKVYKLDPSVPFIGKDLIRLSKRAQRMNDHKKWKAQFSEFKDNKSWYSNRTGEIILISQIGWGPRKSPRPENHRYPMLRPVRSFTHSVKMKVEGAGTQKTEFLYSMEDVAIKTLNGDFATLVAKRVAGVVAKAVVADQIRQQNQGLGDLAWIVMNVADQADLRHWSTLPSSIQIARLRVKPGKYKIYVGGLSHRGMATGESAEFHDVEVKPGRQVFLNWRTVE